MSNERHFYGVSGNSGRAKFQREIERQQAEAEARKNPGTARQSMTAEQNQRYADLKARVKMLVAGDEYLRIVCALGMDGRTIEQDLEWMEAEIIRIECADPMREFRAEGDGEFDPSMDADLYTL